METTDRGIFHNGASFSSASVVDANFILSGLLLYVYMCMSALLHVFVDAGLLGSNAVWTCIDRRPEGHKLVAPKRRISLQVRPPCGIT